jgi:hypothetical protein
MDFGVRKVKMLDTLEHTESLVELLRFVRLEDLNQQGIQGVFSTLDAVYDALQKLKGMVTEEPDK